MLTKKKRKAVSKSRHVYASDEMVSLTITESGGVTLVRLSQGTLLPEDIPPSVTVFTLRESKGAYQQVEDVVNKLVNALPVLKRELKPTAVHKKRRGLTRRKK